MALFWSLFTRGSFLVDFLENEIVGFYENLTVASSSSSDTVQGSVLLPHYRTLEVRPGRIS